MTRLVFPDAAAGATEVPVPETGLLVGRNASCDLPIREGAVSGRHASLRRVPGGAWTVRDEGSSNGTFVNGKQVSEATLRDGDEIAFRDVRAVFSDDGRPTDATAPAPARRATL